MKHKKKIEQNLNWFLYASFIGIKYKHKITGIKEAL